MEGCRFVLHGIIASTRPTAQKWSTLAAFEPTDSVLRPPAERPDSTARWPVARARLASLPVADSPRLDQTEAPVVCRM